MGQPERDQVMRDSLAHVRRVGDLLSEFVSEIIKRAIHHDECKFSPQEWEVFARFSPKLKQMVYGSDEYNACLEGIKSTVEYHYSLNPHHPEHYPDEVNGMDLIDLMEMIADWKAASERHAGGDFVRSFEINAERFNLSPQLSAVLLNTARRYKWIDSG